MSLNVENVMFGANAGFNTDFEELPIVGPNNLELSRSVGSSTAVETEAARKYTFATHYGVGSQVASSNNLNGPGLSQSRQYNRSSNLMGSRGYTIPPSAAGGKGL